jgi:hypothetical protein
MPTLFVDFLSTPAFLVPTLVLFVRIPGMYWEVLFIFASTFLGTWRLVLQMCDICGHTVLFSFEN